jgi:DNA ligase-4
LLPQLDRERQHYGIKEKNLAKMFAEALMLPPKEADRLKSYKNPTKQPAGHPAGEFVEVLLSVIKDRTKNESKQITVAQLINHLD